MTSKQWEKEFRDLLKYVVGELSQLQDALKDGFVSEHEAEIHRMVLGDILYRLLSVPPLNLPPHASVEVTKDGIIKVNGKEVKL